MAIIICPGMHEPQLTQSFLTHLGAQLYDYRVFPNERYAAYSGLDVLKFLEHEFSFIASPGASDQAGQNLNSLLFIGFSAGVVGAIAAAWAWQLLGGEVKALIALDGWGVPLSGDFPIYRLSHDYFTHWSSALLGNGISSFYADPPIPHLELWRSPHIATGYAVNAASVTRPTTAAEFLTTLLIHYGEAKRASVE